MTRPSSRIVWGLLGLCLFASAFLSFGSMYGLPTWARSMDLRRLEILLDGMALMFWMLVFGIYWTNKK